MNFSMKNIIYCLDFHSHVKHIQDLLIRIQFKFDGWLHSEAQSVKSDLQIDLCHIY